MRGIFTATYAISGLAAAKTVMYLTVPSNMVVEIYGASVSDASNETSEQIDCVLQNISSLIPAPTATTVTPDPHEPGDAAADSTVKGNVTASEPTYSGQGFGRRGIPTVGGWEFQPTPEERVIVPGAGSIGIRLLAPATPAAFDAVVTLTFREIG